MYGEAEVLIGEAIADRRDELFLVSKVLPTNGTRAGVVQACERSLKRLKTDQLDCYLLHWRGRLPLADAVDGFEQLVLEGKILSWGVSNFGVDDLEDILAVSGPGRIACNQVLYNLKTRAIEHEVIGWCEAHDVAVVGYSPFGHDDFPAPASEGGRALARIAEARDSTPRQVALAWLARRAFVIPKASTWDHAVANAVAGDLELTEAEAAEIDQAFPRGPRPSGVPMI